MVEVIRKYACENKHLYSNVDIGEITNTFVFHFLQLICFYFAFHTTKVKCLKQFKTYFSRFLHNFSSAEITINDIINVIMYTLPNKH